jgi:polygalacturonase
VSFSCIHGRLVIIVVLSVLSLLVSRPTAARTWYVRPDSTGDAPTIYAAIDSASYGDTVLVAPGTYYRERDKPTEMGIQVWLWLKDGVTITSEEGPEATVLADLVTHIANNTA